MREIQREVLTASSERLNELYIKMQNRRVQLDKWFDMFLDKFDTKLDDARRDDPVRRLYNTKMDEYSDLTKTMRITEAAMRGQHV